MKKKLLLDALSSENSQENADTEISETSNITSEVKDDIIESSQNNNIVSVSQSTETMDTVKNNDEATNLAQEKETPSSTENIDENSKETVAPSSSTNTQATDEIMTDSDKTEYLTPESKAKTVRTEYGTPIIDSVTNFTKLPSDDKFAKDICDILYFENLPNSIGKYKKISTLLKKVKDQVDMIQDS